MTTSTIRSRDESSELTKTSTSPLPILSEAEVTGTAQRLRVVTSEQAQVQRPRFVSLDSLIQEQEATEEGRASMVHARQELAEQLAPLAQDTLKRFRLRAGLSQSNLGRLIGTTQAHIARIETGKVNVQVGTLLRIAKVLHIPPGLAFEAFVANYSEQ